MTSSAKNLPRPPCQDEKLLGAMNGNREWSYPYYHHPVFRGGGFNGMAMYPNYVPHEQKTNPVQLHHEETTAQTQRAETEENDELDEIEEDERNEEPPEDHSEVTFYPYPTYCSTEECWAANKRKLAHKTTVKKHSKYFSKWNFTLHIPLPKFLMKDTQHSISAPRSMKDQNIVRDARGDPQFFKEYKQIWPLLGKYKTVPYRKKKSAKCGANRRRRYEPNIEGRGVGGSAQFWPPFLMYGRFSQQKLPNQEFSDIPLPQPIQISNGNMAAPRAENDHMEIVAKLSELKAREHIAEENRVDQEHKTKEAKKHFQESIGEEVNLLADAKRAELEAKRAFSKVVGLEKQLAGQDRNLHRLKEAEDLLYEELLQREAESAIADLKLIPNLHSEEDIQAFINGNKYM